MTRKETEIIKKFEKKAWVELQRYDYENTPRTNDVEKRVEWGLTDPEHNELRERWNAFYELMQELGIESDLDPVAVYYTDALYTELSELRGAKHDSI